jgi:hypothetical protein
MQRNTTLLAFVFSLLSQAAFSQKTDSTKRVRHFYGSVSVTNNGISLVPTFSLGKPAAILNLSMGGEKFSFEPDLRFSLEGKPWSFLFWSRYRLINKNRYRLTIGAHPALNFKTARIPVKGGDSSNVTIARRYLAGELAPGYSVSSNFALGVYYLYSRGLDDGTVKNTHFLTLNSTISNIKLPGKVFLRVAPQVYYLKQDARDGFYATASVSLTRKQLPVSVAAIFNKTIRSEIITSRDFVWNVSLIYSFGRKFTRI